MLGLWQNQSHNCFIDRVIYCRGVFETTLQHREYFLSNLQVRKLRLRGLSHLPEVTQLVTEPPRFQPSSTCFQGYVSHPLGSAKPKHEVCCMPQSAWEMPIYPQRLTELILSSVQPPLSPSPWARPGHLCLTLLDLYLCAPHQVLPRVPPA